MSTQELKFDLPADLALSDEELDELSKEFINPEVDRLELRPTAGTVEAKDKAKTKAQAQQQAVIAQTQEVAKAKTKGVSA